MFEAQYIHVTGSANDTKEILGPWMPRAADNITFTVEAIDSSAARISVNLVEKNLEDTGGGTQTSATTAQISSSTASDTYSGCKELVRYRYIVELTTSGAGYVLFRMLPDVWYDDVDDTSSV